MQLLRSSKRSAGKRMRDVLRDRKGAIAVITGLLTPVMIGFVGIGTEVGVWLYTRQSMQGAADSAALGGANAVATGFGSQKRNEAIAAAAQYGFVATNGTTITVNQPPTSGNFTASANAVEVIIRQPQTRLFSALFTSADLTIAARAVALAGHSGDACVLALNGSARGAISAGGTATIDLNGCSIASNSNDSSAALFANGSAVINAFSALIVGGVDTVGRAQLDTTNGIFTGVSPIKDPYANVSMPAAGSCAQSSLSVHGATTLSPGTFCNGITVNSGATLTLNPGTYVIDRGSFTVNGGATVTGNGVTLVFTSTSGSGYATASINGGATVTLSAPTSGDMAGIVMFDDRNAPTSHNAFTFNGGSTQNLTGALYLSPAAVTFAGGDNTKTSCVQLVADTVSYDGNAVFANNCSGKGTKSIIAAPSTLVE
jgi:hypothetical protein